MQVVQGLLLSADQFDRPRPVPHLQCEHLQVCLAALQGVAALVRQPGDHLPDRRQPLGLQRPLLRPFPIGDVPVICDDRSDARVGQQVLADRLDVPPCPISVPEPEFGRHR